MTFSIRVRNTLWYTAVLTLLLTTAGTAFYLIYARSRILQIDEDLARTANHAARLVLLDLQEGLNLAQAAPDTLEDIDVADRLLGIFDKTGVELGGQWMGLPAFAGFENSGTDQGPATITTPSGRFRVHRALHQDAATAFYVGVAQPLAAHEEALSDLRRALLAGFSAALLLGAAGGWWIASAALRPVSAMAAQAHQITIRASGWRLYAPNPGDELGTLAASFNGLLARLEAALMQQRQFMADAAHELRTPLSAARTAIEVTLGRESRSEEEYRESLAIVGGQLRRLTRLVEDMFSLALADAAELRFVLERVYLNEIVAGCVKEANTLGSGKGVSVVFSSPGDIEIDADQPRLRQLFMNLIDNAIHHSPADGCVRVHLSVDGASAEISVTDSGCGIPWAERERIFERFVRLDPSRRPGSGTGLGLAIARTIAEAHGGTVALARSDSTGSTFTVKLPIPGHRV